MTEVLPIGNLAGGEMAGMVVNVGKRAELSTDTGTCQVTSVSLSSSSALTKMSLGHCKKGGDSSI